MSAQQAFIVVAVVMIVVIVVMVIVVIVGIVVLVVMVIVEKKKMPHKVRFPSFFAQLFSALLDPAMTSSNKQQPRR